MTFLLVALALAARADIRFEDLPQLVREGNGRVAGAIRSLQEEEAGTGHLTRSYLPRISVEGGAEVFNSGRGDGQTQPFASISAQINLFRAGRDSLEESVRSKGVLRRQLDQKATWVDELTAARLDYWNLIALQEVIQATEDALAQNSLNKAQAAKRVVAGFGSETDRYEFEIYQATLEQELRRLKLQKKSLGKRLQLRVGTSQEITVPGKLIHEHDDQLLVAQLSPAQHRTVQRLILEMESADLRRSQVSRWWTPSLDAYGGYFLHTFREREYANASDRAERVIGAKLSFSLFDGLQSRSEMGALAARRDSLQALALHESREVSARFDQVKEELLLAHELIHGAETNVEQGLKYLRGTTSEYARGQKNSVDVMGATIRYLELKKRWIEIRRDYQLARTELMSLLEL